MKIEYEEFREFLTSFSVVGYPCYESNLSFKITLTIITFSLHNIELRFYPMDRELLIHWQSGKKINHPSIIFPNISIENSGAQRWCTCNRFHHFNL